MRKTLPKSSKAAQFLEFHEFIMGYFPQVYSVLTDSERFQDIRFYFRGDDGYLGVLKGYSSDGGPVVCFGSGYDVLSCFFSLEGSVAADAWKIDKPYESRNG